MNKFVSAAALRALLAVAVIVCASRAVVVAQTVPAPWAVRDIGAPALSGSASHASGIFTVTGAGTDVYGTADQFVFLYRQISGDVDISAKIEDLDGSNAYAKAGVMIRKSLSANAAHSFPHATVGAGIRHLRRPADGGKTAVRGASSAAAPSWVRVVRKGSSVTSYWSRDGSAWSTIGTDTISLGSSAYVGIAVNGRSASSRATARVSNLKIAAAAPAQALPSGQKNTDIGAPALSGSTAYSSGTYTIKAAGYDIWDTGDQFHFVHQPVTGDVEIVARVASITNQHAWSKAGVMVRESLNANARHAMMVTSVGKGYAFQRRPETGAYSEHTSGGTGTAPGWVRLVRKGDLFESYRSADGAAWRRVGSDTIAMGETLYVGLAVTSHDAAALTTAVITNVRITASAPGTNGSPVVTLTSPGSGTQVTLPATVTMAATATDPENRMASVDFYAGSTLVSRDISAPYVASWVPPAAGTYSLTAVAHDADGGSSISSGISVTVSAAVVSGPRGVAFTASADHAAVTRYVLKIFGAGANPATATPVAASDLGKPAPDSNGDITVDRATFFSQLAVGNYIATVSAVGSGGETPSGSISFTR